MNGAEITDAERSGLFPYASFTGSHSGNNRVFAWRSEDEYQGTTYLCSRDPGELFLTGETRPSLTAQSRPGRTWPKPTRRARVIWHWRKALRHRSQRTNLTWKRMFRIANRWLPFARITHPRPSVRFDARTQGRSPVR